MDDNSWEMVCGSVEDDIVCWIQSTDYDNSVEVIVPDIHRNTEELENDAEYVRGPDGYFWGRDQVSTPGVSPFEIIEVESASETLDTFRPKFEEDNAESATYVARQYEQGDIPREQAVEKLERIYDVTEFEAEGYLDGIT